MKDGDYRRKTYYAFADFEFTMPYIPGQTQEILSIGCIILDGLGNKVDTFYRIVKPSTKNRKLANKCTALTGITQTGVDKSKEFSEVYPKFIKFLYRYKINQIYVWGSEDKKVIASTIFMNRYSCIGKGFYNKIINIQGTISRSIIALDNTVFKKTCGLTTAFLLYTDGAELTKEHNALQDAIRLAKLAIAYYKAGKSLHMEKYHYEMLGLEC